MTTPEIEELKQLVKQKYGKTLATTTDFEEFSLYLKNLNSATLLSIKLFKYLSNKKLPRILPCRRIHLS